MTLQDFKDQMNILMGDFGSDEYTPTKTQIIWETCRDLPERNFAIIIQHFLETRSVKYPPLPTHFKEAAIEQRKALKGESNYGKLSLVDDITMSDATLSLQEYLEKIGATDILDAIKKNAEH